MSESEPKELWPDNPYSVPKIECGSCGAEHHPDAASGEFRPQGRCKECGAFLRLMTESEEKEFIDFMEWNTRQVEP